MGQKVHPIGIRLGIVKDWSSKWYADSKTFPEYVRMDHLLRTFIKKKLKDASVSRIHIERPAKKANITIFTARPGIVIGKKGEDIEKLRAEVSKMIGMSINDVLFKGANLPKRKVFFGYEPKLGTAMRDGDWKMIVKQGKVQLYNLAEDIGERNNLAEKYPGRAKTMHAEIEAWKKETAWQKTVAEK